MDGPRVAESSSGRVHVVGAATSAGAHGAGQEQAPDAFRRYGLIERLTSAGLRPVDHGDVVHCQMRPDPDHRRLGSAERVVDAARAVAGCVQSLLRTSPADRVLVLGGDCTIQLGVVAGAKAAAGDAVGLAYIDLDCDLTSPANGNGFADWMGVTHLLDAPDADPRLAGLDGRPPLLTTDTFRLVAADLATPYEQQRLDDLGITRYTSARVTADPGGIVRELVAWAEGLELLSVHVDVDVLDQVQFPIAQEERDTPGAVRRGPGTSRRWHHGIPCGAGAHRLRGQSGSAPRAGCGLRLADRPTHRSLDGAARKRWVVICSCSADRSSRPRTEPPGRCLR